ncbi:hypothetical protein HPB52_001234 [Rhipicephalus sanguineus]|uniref:Tick transposon n=1 Tax=Rhipicephalus sanguineus TaxID=34632 RepID=A0A9D4Q4R1_RHISA|nr:hypothetical protein HPB52_001234 [Rhipicephalus sanguineus]
MVEPIPRHIHPVYNKGRIVVRANTILKRVGPHSADVLFVDAAKYDGNERFAITVVDARATLINAASVLTKHVHVAEETAIALALNTAKQPVTVYSDARAASLQSVQSDFPQSCSKRGHDTCSFDPMLWLCPFNVGSTLNDAVSWDERLSSPDLTHQLHAVQRARVVAESHRLE